MSSSSTDRIERTDSPARAARPSVARPHRLGGVWRVVRRQGGGPFAPGAHVRGAITHRGYEHVVFDITIERMEPERLFSWRWHPHPVEPGVDYLPSRPHWWSLSSRTLPAAPCSPW